ncbi:MULTISPECIES: carboxyl transferase domain-containing protein [unclassified Variovorax]|uniref:carboxyl transferase domain-containing protein n=1 Tax=unclassified Variovorax TaxID=663243 RepID=UPI0008D371FC|nr:MULTISPECIES: carboxyl transferase domain-containing protein [unclassified Variovorax]SEK14254.1 Acetyl/propionyl-CoA carboxylase, alpha subunit [Variovorax sp. OK202]SFD96158.1 Acetyl/propionyl-CoA carboxylase, alpha subunit [Variovorax sp. OK212]
MFSKVLIANRGEIAVRLVRALRDLGIASVAVHARDDAAALHVQLADTAVALDATGPAAYLDIAAPIAVAKAQGCDAVHPGYGFLSERADFAQACADAGLVFIGPTPEQLGLFGDKARARALAAQCDVPVMPGSAGAVTLAQAQAFFAEQHAQGAGVMVKAIGGGGGRGMRAVLNADELPEAHARCMSEAKAAFGIEGVYVERLMRNARHIEVQVLGDGQAVASLGERECTLQRRFQKLVEIAPSPSLPEALRAQVTQAALRMAKTVGYRGLGTFEFLVDAASATLPFVFIEANPRLQVEHTVTEAVTGLDLVQLQIEVAAGQPLSALGVEADRTAPQRGFAVQWRINAETLDAQGNARPSGGTLARFELPAGPGVRVDTHGYAGLAPSPHYDTLLAKLIVHSPSPRFEDALRRSLRALDECRIDGIATNLALLRAIAARPEFVTQAVHTRFVEAHLGDLLAAAALIEKHVKKMAAAPAAPAAPAAQAAVADDEPNELTVKAPMPARLVQFEVDIGDVLPAGAQLGVLEAMKMEHLLHAPVAGRVVALLAAPGDYLVEGQSLVRLEAVDAQAVEAEARTEHDLGAIRPDLQKVIDRHAPTLDANRKAAVDKRHAQGGRTARENIADLCDTVADPGNFIEYGALAIAAQTRRRTLEDLIANTPADGMVTGLGSINAQQFGPEASRCAVLAYDYTVLAGTQGMRNHHKTDRLLAVAHQLKLPVVLFAEGGGGRPGDTDMPIVAGLNNHTFSQFAALSGKVPVVGIVHGRCFAGNAALLGCADVIIATKGSNIGMSGPAMIEGGGLGSFAPEQIGPSSVQSRNGVIDILVEDEAAAVAAAKQYLSYFQGPTTGWQGADPRTLRHVVPQNRLRVYDVRAAMRGVADTGSLLELRAGFGAGIVTALARIEGKPVGLMANNPHHLGGAIDVEAADKSARFMQLCNAHGLPIVSLCDTPGFMVGPEIEAQAQVRHVCRMFMVASHLRVPFFAVVLRKGYGLGAQAMTAGGFDAPVFTVAWPTGEFGAMGLEGAVRLGFRKELAAVAEGAERDALFKKLVDQQYANGEAIHMAQTLEIDAVIDPAETRTWLVRGLNSATRAPQPVSSYVDTW